MRTLQENINQVNSDFNAIKAKIVEKGVEVAEGTKTEDYAAKVGAVYEAGKKAEYDKFWDIFQENGNKTHYSYAFAGYGWTPDIFHPKYNMTPQYTSSMFFQTNMEIDLVQHLEECGITLDTSKSLQLGSMFYNTRFTRVGVIDCRGSTAALTNLCAYSRYLQTIDKLIVSAVHTWVGAFVNCSALENVTFEGVIGAAIDFKDCTKLSKASITSIINALSTTTSGLTITLSKVAKEAAFTTDEWAALIATKSNWTISLV